MKAIIIVKKTEAIYGHYSKTTVKEVKSIDSMGNIQFKFNVSKKCPGNGNYNGVHYTTVKSLAKFQSIKQIYTQLDFGWPWSYDNT